MGNATLIDATDIGSQLRHGVQDPGQAELEHDQAIGRHPNVHRVEVSVDHTLSVRGIQHLQNE